ncbi:MAG: c(7)-type cytochrome triheme domain-containing protein [Thermodesulfobacteriota bacterium]
MKKQLIALLSLVLFVFCGFALAQEFGLKKKRPKPHEFGTIVIDNYSSKANKAPVVFKHWLHRARYSCRLCHVDIGFAMNAGATNITEKDNQRGLFCGSCHNGKIAFDHKNAPKKGKTALNNCVRCHSYGEKVEFKYDFYEFQKNMPRERFGNGIDWEKAEKTKKINVVDFLEGVSIKGLKIKDPALLDLKPLEKNMPEIIFSHGKHTKWSGCELCHPELFGVKQGSQPYSMEEIFAGKYCGVCHGPVAFPNIDCQRCHTKLVY